MYSIHIIYKIAAPHPPGARLCKELKRLRGEFQEAETAAATLEADMVHQEMSNRALVLLDTKGWWEGHVQI